MMRSSDPVGSRSVNSRPAIIAARGSWLVGLIALVLTLLSGCSAVRLAYNQAPDLSYWWLDSYFDFSDEQTPRVRSGLGQWFDWHRRTQLPDYVALLQRAQAEVLADQSPERLCGWWGEVRSRFEVSIERGVPLAAEVMLSFSPAQIAHIERHYAKSNADFRDDYLSADPKQRTAKSVQRVIERAELLYGRLDTGQRERIGRLVADSPFDPELWLAERERRQQEALQMLRRVTSGTVGRDTAEAALRASAQHLLRSPRERYRQYAQRLEQFNCNFASVVHNSTSPAQRQTAAAKLKAWETDLRSLGASLTTP
jgi:hypothetical protein